MSVNRAGTLAAVRTALSSGAPEQASTILERDYPFAPRPPTKRQYGPLERLRSLATPCAIVGRLAPLIALVLAPLTAADAQRVAAHAISGRVGSLSTASARHRFDDVRERCRRGTIIRHAAQGALVGFLAVTFLPIATDGDGEELALRLGATGGGALVGGLYGSYQARKRCTFRDP